VAVDFDGVIHTYERGWADGTIYGDLMPGAMTGLLRLMDDHAVFVHTTRNAGQVARWIERQSSYAIECTTRMTWWLPAWWQWGKRHRFWNTTGVLLVTNRKLPAVAYLDDRAVRFESWDASLSVLLADR
jgi:hypothetical protein